MGDPDKIRLVAQLDIPTLDVTILDDRFQFVHRSVGGIDVELAPGNYLLQYRAGSTVTEEAVSLRPGEPTHVLQPPKLSTQSPVPIAGSDAFQRYGSFAQQASREIHERRGQGGQLLIMVRTSTKDLEKSVRSDALFDVRLLDANREVVVDLREAGRTSDDGTAKACNLELTPGSYLLRYRVGDPDELEQTIVVSPHWQTQIFSSSRPYGEAGHYGPNLPEAGVLMVPSGDGFDPDDRNVVIAESARLALAGSYALGPDRRLKEARAEAEAIRASAPPDQVGELLRAKFRNPMLGIYGAHLLLISGDTQWDLVRSVVMTLKSLLGPHPDMLALTGVPQLRDLADETPHNLPPMLRNSWTLLVGHSAERPATLPATAYAATIANRVWGSQAWLVWRPPAKQAAAARSIAPGSQAGTRPMTVDAALTTIRRYVIDNYRTAGSAALIRSLADTDHLTDTERTILLYFIRAVQQGRDHLSFVRTHSSFLAQTATRLYDWLEHRKWADRLTGGLTLDPLVLGLFKKTSLVRALGVPSAALDDAIVTLASKLASASSRSQDLTRSPTSG